MIEELSPAVSDELKQQMGTPEGIEKAFQTLERVHTMRMDYFKLCRDVQMKAIEAEAKARSNPSNNAFFDFEDPTS